MFKSTDIEKTLFFDKSDNNYGFLLTQVSTTWKTAIHDALKPIGITHPQFVVLATLQELTQKNGYVNQVEISRTSGYDVNTLSHIIRLLAAKHFIIRTRSHDERSKHAVLTSLGANILEQGLPLIDAADDAFFASLTTSEYTVLGIIFNKLISTKKQMKKK
jgi:DNA-binding MarR family transcriptional regulator